MLDWKFVYILLIIENTTGMPHLKKQNWFPVVSSAKKKRYSTFNLRMGIDGDLIQDSVQNLSQNRETKD